MDYTIVGSHINPVNGSTDVSREAVHAVTDNLVSSSAENIPASEQTSQDAPFCNTGSSFTKTLIDWQSLTFPLGVKVEDVLDLFTPIFDPRRDDARSFHEGSHWVSLERGLYSYKKSYKRGNITVLCDGAADMGVHVQMSGQGCRQFEDEQFIHDQAGWLQWFRLLSDRGVRWSRLDVAMDDGGYLTKDACLDMSVIQQAIDDGHVVSVFKKSSTVDEKRLGVLRPGESKAQQLGDTIYLGNRKSSQMFVRIYNKSLETMSKDGITPPVGYVPPTWVRVELCARSHNANELVAKILEHGFQVVPEILLHYIDFKEPNDNDLNRTRWPSAPWWSKFLDNVKGRALGVAPAVPSLAKSVKWVKKQVAVTLALMLEACAGDLTELTEIMRDGKRRFRPQHHSMLAAYQALVAPA